MGKRIVAVIMSIVLTVPMVSIYKETDSRAATMGKVNQTGITSIEASTLPIQTKFKKTLSKKFKSIQNKNRLNGSKNISKDTLRDGEHSTTVSVNSYLEYEGDLAFIPATISSGQIIQATLRSPEVDGINYDLFLYENDNGDLGDLIDYCDVSGVEDSLAYINNTNIDISVYVIAYAYSGYSTTEPFNLTVSIDSYGYYDPTEPNENAFSAYDVSNVVSGSGVTISGLNLNVSNDQDWFYWSVPSNSNASYVVLNNSDYGIDVYTVDSGSHLSIVNTYGNAYVLSDNDYYIRVKNKASSFSPGSYSISFVIRDNTPYSMSLVSVSTDTSPNAVNYGQGNYYRSKHSFSSTVEVLTADGYPAVGANVGLLWTSESWIPESGNHTRSTSGITDGEGRTTLQLTLPHAIGYRTYSISGPISITHHYDLDSLLFSWGNYNEGMNLYHLAYSD